MVILLFFLTVATLKREVSFWSRRRLQSTKMLCSWQLQVRWTFYILSVPPLSMTWPCTSFFRKGAGTNRGLPSGRIRTQPSSPHATTHSAWSPSEVFPSNYHCGYSWQRWVKNEDHEYGSIFSGTMTANSRARVHCRQTLCPEHAAGINKSVITKKWMGVVSATNFIVEGDTRPIANEQKTA